MTPIIDTLSGLKGTVLMTAGLLLLLGELSVLLSTLRDRMDRRRVGFSLCCAGLGFVLFALLLGTMMIFRHGVRMPWERRLISVPWAVFAVLEAGSAVLLALGIRAGRKYRATHLTPDAVRETMDLLPEGIAVSRTDGTVLLCNLKMDALCREITGGILSDASRFWQHIETSGEKQGARFLIRTPEEKVWRFGKDRLVSEGLPYDRITASDVTEQVRVLAELKEKNVHLLDIRRRMKALSSLTEDMFVAQEEANARTALHNQLGQVLLTGRHLLDHPEETDADMVYMITRQMNQFLLGEAEGPAREPEDPWFRALRMAKNIGVSVRLQGELPAKDAWRALIGQAVQESAVNAVKHAAGDALTVSVSGKTVTIANNGKPPKGPIVESGGLKAIRRLTEEAGGTMQVRSLPAFQLSIRFPDESRTDEGNAFTLI